MTVKAICPHCQQSYKVPEGKLGKQVTCKKCNNNFTLQQEQVDLELIEESPSDSPKEQKSGGFWDSVKAAGKKVAESVQEATQGKDGVPPPHKMLQTKFVTGPFDLKPGMPLYVYVQDGDFVALTQQGFCKIEAFRLPVLSVKKTEIDTAERMTIARAAMLGIFAFGMKKKEKLLQIDFDDAGLEATMVLGPGKAEELNNKILAARREAAQKQVVPDESGSPNDK